MARGSTRPAQRRLPARLPMPHTYVRSAETGCCAHPGCGLPRSNAIRHLHDHAPDPRDSATCVRCGLPAYDMRHQDQQARQDVAMAAAGEYVAA
jgi:ribosomal protein L37E